MTTRPLLTLLLAAACVGPARAGAPPPATPPAPLPAAAPAASPPSGAPAQPGSGSTAVVLAVVASDAEGKTWLKRWNESGGAYMSFMEVPRKYPRIVPSEELGAPDVPTGSKPVVLGYCPKDKAEETLAFLKTIYPQATTMATSRNESTCPETWVRPLQSRVVAVKDWRLVVNVYLNPAGEGDGARRQPPDPNSGRLTVSATLFDPTGALRGYDSKLGCSSLTDLVTFPNRCEIKLSETSDSVVADLRFEGSERPCTGTPYRVVSRATYRVWDNGLVVKDVDLEKKVAKLCD